MTFSVITYGRPDGVRLAIRGEIDLASCGELRQLLHDAIAESDNIIEADLSEVAFLDCTGVGAFVHGRQVARQAGRTLVATNAHGAARMVLEVTGVLPLLQPRDATAAASH